MKAAKLAILGLCAGAGASAGAVSCGKGEMYCTSAFGHFAVVLDLEKSSGDCEGAPVNLEELDGESAILETYADKGAKDLSDWSHGNLVIKTGLMGNYEGVALSRGAENQGKSTVARAEFAASNPDADGFCKVSKFKNGAELELDELEADVDTDTGSTSGDAELFPGQEAIDWKIDWSEMTMYVTPDAQGTQFTATVEMELNGCEAKFSAVGLYPEVHCEKDKDCEDKTNGINPSFDVKCDDDSGMCTLERKMPSYE
ncbi:MAG: hypothetical protein V3V08_15510 [Nannocystaceae bacterium]